MRVAVKRREKRIVGRHSPVFTVLLKFVSGAFCSGSMPWTCLFIYSYPRDQRNPKIGVICPCTTINPIYEPSTTIIPLKVYEATRTAYHHRQDGAETLLGFFFWSPWQTPTGLFASRGLPVCANLCAPSVAGPRFCRQGPIRPKGQLMCGVSAFRV